MAPTLTIETAEKEYNAAVAHGEELQARWLKGKCSFDELAAARQMVAHLGGRLEAMQERATARRQEAETEAARKIAEQKRRLEAEAALPVVEKRRTTAENFVSAAIEIHHVFKSPQDNPVKVALSLVVDALDSEVHGGPDRGALDRIRQEILHPSERRKLEALRKELAETKATLAATNGSHTKKGSVSK
jgi:hypothetical protein